MSANGESDSDYEYDYDSEDNGSVCSENSDNYKLSTYESNVAPPTLERDISSQTRALLLDPSAEVSYKTCHYTKIFPKVQFLISRVAELFNVDEDTSQTLLCHYRWSEETLTENYLCGSDEALAACGLPPSARARLLPQIPLQSSVQCPVCFDDTSAADCYSLVCGHVFCRECFVGHLTACIDEGPDCVHSTCPGYQCRVPIALGTVRQLCTTTIMKKYEKYLISHFVSMSSHMRFCPGSGCEQIAYGRSFKNDVQCQDASCSECFCFKCGSEAHDPCSCEQLRLWNLKSQDENESLVYLHNRTRSCPSCKISVEADAVNCGYMRCKSCSSYFCWHCMQVTHDHRHITGKPCNKFEPDKGQNESEIARQRTVHYYGRYQGHLASLRGLTDRVLPDIRSRLEAAEGSMLALQSNESNERIELSMELSSLKEQELALQEVQASRRALVYSYVLGYHLRDETPEKQLFEHQQSILEGSTDALAELVQKVTAKQGTCGSESKKEESAEEMTDEHIALVNSLKAVQSFRESVFSTLMSHNMALSS